MAFTVTLKNSSSKKGKYKYDTNSDRDITDQPFYIGKDKLLKLWLVDNNGKISDSSLAIETKKAHLFGMDFSQSDKLEWQLTLTTDTSSIPPSQRKHEENANHHGCGEEPGTDPSVTVTIGEP